MADILDETLLDYDETGLEPELDCLPRSSTPIEEFDEAHVQDHTLEISMIEVGEEWTWVCSIEDSDEEFIGVDELEELESRGELEILDIWDPVDAFQDSDLNQVSQPCSKGFRNCQLCGFRSQTIGRHLRSHLPPYAIPDKYCWNCKRYFPQSNRQESHTRAFGCGNTGKFSEEKLMTWVQLMTGVLFKICIFLGLPGLSSLYDMVRSTFDLHVDPSHTLSKQNARWIQAFEVRNFIGTKSEKNYTLDPINSIGLLTHWRVLVNLFKLLTPTERDSVRELHAPINHLGIPINFLPNDPRLKSPFPASDAHFHLDKLMLRLRTCDWNETCRSIPLSNSDVKLEFLVTCSAFPESWPKMEFFDQIAAARYPFLRLTIGWHPTRCLEATSCYLSRFQEMLNHDICVAAGEVGLDYHRAKSENVRRRQRELLKNILPLVLLANKPLVLHCRDAEMEEESSATRDLIAILERELPRTWRIYVHCFNGGLSDYLLWIKAFPRVCFGISPMLLSTRRHPELRSVVQRMDSVRLLLETDSPYLSVSTAEGLPSPILVSDVGKEVAKIRRIPFGMAFYWSLQATYMFFQPNLDVDPEV